ncbi:MAG: hypothetical protein MRJ93_09465 [Nitrososphaeraceae archaeon]|nr:hypothetical protein [Nitrososphaeraceae archaeon]
MKTSNLLCIKGKISVSQSIYENMVNNGYKHFLNVKFINLKNTNTILPQPGQKTITVSGKILKRLEELYNVEKIKKPNLSFALFVSESALIEIERRRILKEAQLISLISLTEDTIILKDVRKKNRLVEVQIRNKNLKCITEEKFDCIHVGFALALPEVRKALNS